MGFIAILFATFAMVYGVAGADPNLYKTSLGALAVVNGGLDLYSNCWNYKGCKWEPALDKNNEAMHGVRQCSCNNNPDGWANLVWFYTKSAYTGDVYKGFGKYGECQDLPTTWNQKTESMQVIPAPAAFCSIYTQPNCDGMSGDWVKRDSSDPNQNAIKEFQGFFYKGVQSWKCELKSL